MSCDVPSPAIDVAADDLDDLSQSSSNMDQINYDRTGFFLAVSPEYEQEECNSYLNENYPLSPIQKFRQNSFTWVSPKIQRLLLNFLIFLHFYWRNEKNCKYKSHFN